MKKIFMLATLLVSFSSVASSPDGPGSQGIMYKLCMLNPLTEPTFKQASSFYCTLPGLPFRACYVGMLVFREKGSRHQQAYEKCKYSLASQQQVDFEEKILSWIDQSEGSTD